MISTFLMPSAAADNSSDCSAMRFRSRQVTCMIGSRPALAAARLPARLESRTAALWLSVMLTASTEPRRAAAFSVTGARLAPRGGPISAVTANCPDCRRCQNVPAASSLPDLPVMPCNLSWPPGCASGCCLAGGGGELRVGISQRSIGTYIDQFGAYLAASHFEQAETGDRGNDVLGEPGARAGGFGDADGGDARQHRGSYLFHGSDNLNPGVGLACLSGKLPSIGGLRITCDEDDVAAGGDGPDSRGPVRRRVAQPSRLGARGGGETRSQRGYDALCCLDRHARLQEVGDPARVSQVKRRRSCHVLHEGDVSAGPAGDRCGCRSILRPDQDQVLAPAGIPGSDLLGLCDERTGGVDHDKAAVRGLRPDLVRDAVRRKDDNVTLLGVRERGYRDRAASAKLGNRLRR